ncbi:NRDE family protein [Novosphingobium guangzhouense]|uniref:NRDE family protein n=1 Tax=Novosphingobium guangzhouense TaxID=1850347 RepID=A0A2K2G0Q0_9SPHN|nr:NRDE family protein [Novosphingobium guangzhouense]PNU04621.1 hypothetical protein A8V01_19635 [Novosphingobium guangzhouense]
MCVAAVAWDAHPDWLLVVAGNRDEFHSRPATVLSNRPDGIIAGTDLTGGGTWLGVTEAGRFALVTNYRVPEGSRPGRPSRGKLVTDLLEGITPDALGSEMARMNPFNLVLADPMGALFLTNYPAVEVRPLEPGIHGLSNGGFDVPWPKTVQVMDAIEHWLTARSTDPLPLLDALRDELPAPSTKSPEEGPEPRFAPVFIRDALYGTRCSTVILVDRAGRGTVVERSFDASGTRTGDVRIDFDWPVRNPL